MWSLDSLDSAVGTNSADILKTLEKGLSPGDIVLMHENRGTTRTALPEIIQMVQAKGLTPVTLSQLLTQDPPPHAQLKAGTCG
jgi:peptidoglycan/xylan/chitin deacetylase (PgdA/CDA1 family)